VLKTIDRRRLHRRATWRIKPLLSDILQHAKLDVAVCCFTCLDQTLARPISVYLVMLLLLLLQVMWFLP
jgi:hypothetical protein